MEKNTENLDFLYVQRNLCQNYSTDLNFLNTLRSKIIILITLKALRLNTVK